MKEPKSTFTHLLALDRQIHWNRQIQTISAGSADPVGSGDPAGAKSQCLRG
jgi:hypothetical protein